MSFRRGLAGERGSMSGKEVGVAPLMSSRRGLAGERGSMSGRELLVFSYELGVLSRDAMLASGNCEME